MKVETFSWALGILVHLNQHTKKGVLVRAGVIRPAYQRGDGLLLQNRGKEELHAEHRGFLRTSFSTTLCCD